jgi:hypothetical protein
MNRLILAASLAGALAGLAACASAPTAQQRFTLTPTQSNGQTLTGYNSRTILESRQPGGIVSVRADTNFAEFGASFIVAVQNKTGGPVEFGPQNVSASINGAAVRVLAAEELDAKVKSDAAGFVRATSRTGGVDVEAATPFATSEYRFNNFGGNAAGNGGGASCALNEGCRDYRIDREARQADARMLAEAASKLQTNAALISQKALRKETVAPEAMAGGVVVVQPPKNGGPVSLTVTFNGQQHRFVFAATPAA